VPDEQDEAAVRMTQRAPQGRGQPVAA
jgi:hypothetical protein